MTSFHTTKSSLQAQNFATNLDKMCPFQAMFDKRRQKIFTQPKAATWCLEPAVSSHFLTLLFEENPSPGRPVTVSGSGTGRKQTWWRFPPTWEGDWLEVIALLSKIIWLALIIMVSEQFDASVFICSMST